MSTPWTFDRHRDTSSQLVWREIFFDKPITPTEAKMLFEGICSDNSLRTMVFEARMTRSKVRWLVGARHTHLGRIAGLLQTMPTLRTRVFNQERHSIDAAGSLRIYNRSLVDDNQRLELAVRNLMAIANRLGQGEELAIQLLIGKRLQPPVQTHSGELGLLKAFLSALVTPPKPRGVPEIMPNHRQLHGAKANLRIGVAGVKNNKRQVQILTQALGALKCLEGSRTRITLKVSKPHRFNHVLLPWRWPLILRSIDIPCINGWPVSTTTIPGFEGEHPKPLLPTRPLAISPRSFATISANGDGRPLSINWSDACYHTHLLGPTGVGKSTAMLTMILADINQGIGTLVIDPKGDLVDDVLDRIPLKRKNDVIVIDPSSTTPIGFNPLATDPAYKQVAADALLETFEALFKDNWGVNTIDVLSHTLHTITCHKQGTMLWIIPLLTNPEFRRKILHDINDPYGVEAFWHRFEAMTPQNQARYIEPVVKKLSQIFSRSGLRGILGQTHPKFHFQHIFDRNAIVLIKLNKGLIGAPTARFLGSIVISHLWTLTLAQQRVNRNIRRTHTVYIDEVHDFLAGIPGDLADALAQARSLGLAFIMANQYRDQLTPEMRSAIDSNTRSKIVFGLTGDAPAMAKNIDELDAVDFNRLAKYQAYANVMNNGLNTGWILINTNPPPRPITNGQELSLYSQNRYGQAVDLTQKQLTELFQPHPSPEATTHVGRTQRTHMSPPPRDQPPQTSKNAPARGGRVKNTTRNTPKSDSTSKPPT